MSDKLKKRNKKIAMLYIKGNTQQSIADKYGISKARVGEILYKELGGNKMASIKEERIFQTAGRKGKEYLDKRTSLK